MEELYDVEFVCYRANYSWIEKTDLTLQEATDIIQSLNKKEKIHPYVGCCHYIIQKQI